MKPTTQHTRPKAWIPFANFALVDTVPETIKLQDHLFPYEGVDMDSSYIWGLYGTLSANQGLFLVDSFARKQDKRPLTIQGWYRVDNFDRVRSQIDAAIAEDSGFLHLDRLKSSFREELRELVLEYGAKEIGGWRREMYEDRSLNEIVIRHPRLIKAIFAYNRKINMVVHPVRQMYEPDDRRTLTVATMRMIKSRVMSVQVRYLEDQIQVTL